ncbi:type IV secretion protein DotIE [Tahibacter amnicola]|uniref:Type IV secretion protein DotIE n=1 Tax=Tahibacter amnicola TaxID=2976241 RepID=A0ABY6BE67_9GAMM|nr:type IV secretion protein DotIE [Tahibacter amnicola]UXI68333.1 type IV secretion protein DotIE [Tahibacter amnicola]
MNSGSPDLMTILINIGVVIPPTISLLQTLVGVIGIWLVAGALIEMWGVSNDGALKYIPGKSRFSVGSAMAQLLVGSFLMMLGTLEMVGIFSRTFTGDYVNSKFLAYTPGGGGTLLENARLATSALYGIMQIVGFVAMIKALMTMNQRANGQQNASVGQACAWMIGGVACWNFKWFAEMLNNTLGFRIIGLFLPT